MAGGRSSRFLRSAAVRRAVIVFGLAIAIRAVYVVTLLPSGCLAINEDPVSDMETFHRWGARIAAGDWLGREEFHPYHPWQRGIASEERWLEWYGPSVFHQDPLYPYFVALVYAATSPAPWSVLLLQHLLGAAGAAGICLLGERIAGPRAGLAAGLLAAAYGPFLFYESLLLRDTLLVFLTTAFLLLIEEARRRPGPLWWGAAGLAAGAIYLTKPNIVIFLPFLAAWILLGSGAGGRSVAALAGGFLIFLAPAVGRNLAVGAPPFKTTTRGAIEFINGNNPYHIGIGWFDGDDPRVTGYARPIMEKTGGRLLATIGEVMRTWRGNLRGFATLQIRKLGFLLAPFEMPNNASYAYFRTNSPVLGAGLPTFYVLSPLALLGLVVCAPRWRELLPHLLFLATAIAGTVAFYVIARFRTPLLPLALVFAGAGADFLIEAATGRRGPRLLAGLAVVAGALAVNTVTTHPDRALVRPQDFAVAAGAFAGRGENLRAAEELEAGLAIFPGIVPMWVEAGRARERAGDPQGALRAYREALRIDPGEESVRDDILRLEAATSPP